VRLVRTAAWRQNEEHWLARTEADLAVGGRLTSRREPMGVAPPERALCRIEEFGLGRGAAETDELLALARAAGPDAVGGGRDR
jgi:hypothetical protein